MPEDLGANFLQGFFKSQELKQQRSQFTQDLAFRQASLAQQSQLAGQQLDFEKMQNARITQHENAALEFQKVQEARVAQAQQFAQHFQTQQEVMNLTSNPAFKQNTSVMQPSDVIVEGKGYKARTPEELTSMKIAGADAEDKFARLKAQRTLQEIPGMISQFYQSAGIQPDPELSTKLAVSHILPTAVPALFAQDKNGTIESGFHELMAPGLAHFSENARKDPNYINSPLGQAFMKLYMSGAEALKAAGATGVVRSNEAVKSADRDRFDYTNNLLNGIAQKAGLQKNDPQLLTKMQAIETAASTKAKREGKQLDPAAIKEFRTSISVAPTNVGLSSTIFNPVPTPTQQAEALKLIQQLELDK